MLSYQAGEGGNYTKCCLSVKLVYYEEYERVEDAFLEKIRFSVGDGERSQL
ncbi:MAG: hypothetical protein IGBAC_1388 [Ignavibacteriae bacterium]|nr:MAG: hypothetical protein IGBAC_1388 [Ignavibacteriota bacterium]